MSENEATSEQPREQPSGSSVGVLIMAYGTPQSPVDIEKYYTHIRRGRPPTPEQLEDLVSRYDAIGGISPMRNRTDAQVEAVRRALNSMALDDVNTVSGLASRTQGEFVVTLGQKHATPFIEDGVEDLIKAGVSIIVGLVLAPHFSAASVGQYHDRARDAIAGRVEYSPIDDWSLEPAFIDFTASSLRTQLDSMPERTTVVFTAHSLPERVLQSDPYRENLTASAAAIAEEAGLGSDWMIGWQSAGRTPEPWAGPDILEIIAGLASDATGEAAGADGSDESDHERGILVVPQGFTSDHLEILYDLDIEARSVAASAGLTLERTETINADPEVMAALAARISTAVSAGVAGGDAARCAANGCAVPSETDSGVYSADQDHGGSHP